MAGLANRILLGERNVMCVCCFLELVSIFLGLKGHPQKNPPHVGFFEETSPHVIAESSSAAEEMSAFMSSVFRVGLTPKLPGKSRSNAGC